MSDNFLRLLPIDPSFVPSPSQEAAALRALESIAPSSEVIEVRAEPEVAFVDAGSNFSAVRCPACGAELAIVPWWQREMDRAYGTKFADLGVVTPCCGAATTLNDLNYDWPQGFARWWLQALNPRRGKLEPDELAKLASALGVRLREVWTHV